MKTAIKLALIYFAMQIIGVFVVGPLARGYAYIEYGSVERAGELAAAPTLLAGIILMSIYLWKQGYLTNDKRRHCLPGVTVQTRLLLFNKCLWLHKQKIKSHHSSTRSAISLASLTASAS